MFKLKITGLNKLDANKIIKDEVLSQIFEKVPEAIPFKEGIIIKFEGEEMNMTFKDIPTDIAAKITSVLQ